MALPLKQTKQRIDYGKFHRCNGKKKPASAIVLLALFFVLTTHQKREKKNGMEWRWLFDKRCHLFPKATNGAMLTFIDDRIGNQAPESVKMQLASHMLLPWMNRLACI